MATRAHYVPRFYLANFAAAKPLGRREPHLWVMDLATGAITRRSPRNIAIARGLYDGPGAYDDGSHLEDRLCALESAAATAIREFVARPVGRRTSIPDVIMWFLAWQASRTPAARALFERWADEDDGSGDVVEPPPDGWERIRPRESEITVQDPNTNTTETVSSDEAQKRQREGWRVVFDDELFREGASIQAWYFGVRHFPRLHWVIFDAPKGQCFVTCDRPCAWGVQGDLTAQPSLLRHPEVVLIAPLTRGTTLVGVHPSQSAHVRAPLASEINEAMAHFATRWVAGPTREAVVEAVRHRPPRLP